MIKLVVDKWCENCKEFEPNIEVDDDTLVEFDYINGTNKYHYRVNTTIRCVHAARCNGMKKYIETQLRRGLNND